jgi:hypothetical protein
MHFHNQDHGGPPTLTKSKQGKKKRFPAIDALFSMSHNQKLLQVSIKSNELPGVT